MTEISEAIIERIRVLKEKDITPLCIIGNAENIKTLSVECAAQSADCKDDQETKTKKDRTVRMFMGLQVTEIPTTLYAPDVITILTDRDLQILSALKSFIGKAYE